MRVPAWEKESKTVPLDKELADLEVHEGVRLTEVVVIVFVAWWV